MPEASNHHPYRHSETPLSWPLEKMCLCVSTHFSSECKEVSMSEQRHNSIPDCLRNAGFGHYWQIFHCTSGMEDEYFVGVRAKAAIVPRDVVGDQHVKLFFTQLGL